MKAGAVITILSLAVLSIIASILLNRSLVKSISEHLNVDRVRRDFMDVPQVSEHTGGMARGPMARHRNLHYRNATDGEIERLRDRAVRRALERERDELRRELDEANRRMADMERERDELRRKAELRAEKEEQAEKKDGVDKVRREQSQEGGDQSSQKQPDDEKKNKEKDLNIVLFYADDWTYRTLGAVNPTVVTPNIDAMAKAGVLFSQNCVTTSICWTSRANLLTGQYAAKHRHTRIESLDMFNETVWPNTLFPQLRHVGGYHTGFVGKWHHMQPDIMSDTFDWSRYYYGEHWMTRDGKRRHVTDLNREDALEYLRKIRPKDKKFALTVSFFATHAWDGKDYPDAYQPTNESEARYAHIPYGAIPVPKTATEFHWNNTPWFFDDRNEGRYRWRQRYSTPEHYQVTMRKYYRMATEVDDAVGAIVEELKAQGELDNTLLIFTTDNGNFHGEHGLADKWYPHEESIRVPLVVQDPRMSEEVRGTVNEEFTLSIDLAPTILSAAGVPIPRAMQGKDMAQLYLDNREQATKRWRKNFFYEWESIFAMYHIPSVYALVSRKFKYFYWDQSGYEQLFNLRDDPWEERDIHNSTLKTSPGMLADVKARFAHLRNLSKFGYPP